MRCAPPANKPLPSERDNCADWLRAELPLLRARPRARLPRRVRVGLRTAPDRAVAAAAPALRATAAEARVGDLTVLGCFHPSQQNTFTGVLTPAMIDAILERARELAQERSASSTSAA